MFTHKHTHTQWLWLARPLWSGLGAKSKPNSGTLGVLCLILEPLALSRPCFKIHCGFEEQHSQQQGGQAWKIQMQQERQGGGGEKEAGEIYVLIHICGRELILDAFNTLTVL